ncbi:MAG TPA: glycosyltransferase [Chthoniobacterales bacterium]|jgi:alpha-1,6-mannosyltransferase
MRREPQGGRLKICDLTQFYSPVSGGVKRYVQEKVNFLREHRPDCEHVLIIPGERTERIVEPQRRIYTIKSPLISKTSRYRMLLNLGAIEDVIEQERPSIIESGDPYQVAWKALATGEALRIPVVAFYHSHFPEAYLRSVQKYLGETAGDALMEAAERYVRHLYNQFAHTLVPSAGLQQLLVDWGVTNTALAELGVNTAVFRPGERQSYFREKHAIPASAKLLLYVGRLAPEKNVRCLFQAFELLTEKSSGTYHLLVVGDGTTRDSLQRLSESTQAVTWLPYCDDSADLTKLYREADLFVHPGVLETFGLVTIESQACGTPVVGIRGSYMDRIVYSNQRHWAAENTPGSLAAAIENTCREDLLLIGAAASEKVRARYDWEIVFRKLLAIYQSCIA